MVFISYIQPFTISLAFGVISTPQLASSPPKVWMPIM